MAFLLCDHAAKELARRGIPRDLLDEVLARPQQIVEGYGGRKVLQSQLDVGNVRVYLLRVIVDDSVDPHLVVTVYRTSKIAKYWRAP